MLSTQLGSEHGECKLGRVAALLESLRRMQWMLGLEAALTAFDMSAAFIVLVRFGGTLTIE